MNTLWFAFIIYILGMAVVLYVRPSLMFDGGAWKEFGLTTTHNNTTIFPFWMFVILWSIASYVAGTLCVLGFSSLSMQGGSVEETAETAETTETAEIAETAPAEETPAEETPLDFNEISQATHQMKKVMEKRKRRIRHSSPSPLERDSPREAAASKKPVPGYYIKGKNKNGKSTYIYYGKEPPFE